MTDRKPDLDFPTAATDLPTTDDEWRRRLTSEQFNVARQGGTERAFTGKYWDEHTDGTYNCVCCHTPLFESTTKYDSGSGWPSFFQPISDDVIKTETDRQFSIVRTEVKCAACDTHLGHVFPDGPQPTGMRYCMNSTSLDLDAAE